MNVNHEILALYKLRASQWAEMTPGQQDAARARYDAYVLFCGFNGSRAFCLAVADELHAADSGRVVTLAGRTKQGGRTLYV